MQRLLPLIPLLLLSLGSACCAQDDDGPGPGELKQLGKITKTWADLASFCIKKKLPTEAVRYAELAVEASPDATAMQKLEERAAKCKDGAKESSRKAFAKKEAKARTKVAKLYDSLAKARVPAERAAGYAMMALRTEPEDGRWKRLSSVLKAAYKADEKDVATKFAAKALELDPGPPDTVRRALLALGDRAAMEGVVLRKAPGHGMRYYLSLPKKYDAEADRTWPVIVCVDGAGSEFKKAARGFAKERGDLPCLIVSPCGFANTNAITGKMREKYSEWYDPSTIERGSKGRVRWDVAGLVAILDDLKANYRAADQVCITGFSGGGNLAYYMLFQHPKRVLAAAPACANFSRPNYDTIKDKHSDEDRDIPIHLITGGQDPHKDLIFGKKGQPGIESQTDWAELAFKEVGYPKVKRTQIPEMKHSRAYKQVVAFFKPYILGKKKRSDPWP